MTIQGFLIARLDEREQSARFTIELTERAYPADEFDVRWKWARLTEHRTSGGGGQSFELGAPTPGDILADIAAKRAVIGFHSGSANWCGWALNLSDHGDQECDTLRALASAYSGHEDYREEWRL